MPENQAPAAEQKNLWQVIKFTLFSISAGVIEIVADTLFNEVVGADPTVSYLIALVLSVLWNFSFNRRYTFRSDANIKRSMLLVALFYVVFTPLSGWWTDVLVKRCGVNEYLVLAGTMIINFITEFIYQRFVVYRNSIDTNDVARKAKQKENRDER